MCGIAGIWWVDKTNGNPSLIKEMTDALLHRGPDAEGQWHNDNGLFLGHRRLAIIDLDARANQPFHFMARYAITYNGEIYNFIELKVVLEGFGYAFYTTSDVEVICAAYHKWGVACLSQFDGMFAFALYDKEEETLFCARDRFGEKPFYYTFFDGVFYFASEMKAFWKVGVPKEARNEMIYNYLVHDLVEDVNDAKNTFFRNIYKLKSSHYFLIKKEEREIKQICYYKLDTNTSSIHSFEEAVEQFSALLYQSVERRMRSDVRVGSTLSGGLDSSTVTAIMSRIKPENPSFSARFKDCDKDEGKFIDMVTAHCSTTQYNVYPNADGLIKEMNKLIFHQEEPFQTGSIYAQYKVYELAKSNDAIVLLDGQGADELLAGYFNYLLPYYFELDRPEQRTLQAVLLSNQSITLKPSWKEKMQFEFPRLFDISLRLKHLITHEKHKTIHPDFERAFARLNTFKAYHNLKETLLHSLTTQGLEKLLRFSDKNAMAHSVEVRLPFLSHHLADFLFTLPSAYFFNTGWTKSILRHAIQGNLPKGIVWRKDKVGFEAPDEQWHLSPAVIEMKNDYKTRLINDKIIMPAYNETWKIINLTKTLYEI